MVKIYDASYDYKLLEKSWEKKEKIHISNNKHLRLALGLTDYTLLSQNPHASFEIGSGLFEQN